VKHQDLTSSQARNLGRWKCGDNVDFYATGDAVLTRLEIHEWEIPEELWLPERKFRSKWGEFSEEGERLLCQGLSPGFVGRDLGVPTTTVRNWRDSLRRRGKVA